jgi:hypothetical protein
MVQKAVLSSGLPVNRIGQGYKYLTVGWANKNNLKQKNMIMMRYSITITPDIGTCQKP